MGGDIARDGSIIFSLPVDALHTGYVIVLFKINLFKENSQKTTAKEIASFIHHAHHRSHMHWESLPGQV